MIEDVLTVLWMFLPLGAANMTPVFTAHASTFSKLYRPIDAGMTYNGKRVLGDHKTWLGLISGTLVGGIISLIQYQIYVQHTDVFFFLPPEYAALSPIFYGMWIGFGGLIGDAVKSFFKRQNNIISGTSWVPYDQLDYVLGGITFSFVLVHLSFLQYALAILLFFVLHIASTWTGYCLGLKSSPL